MKDDDLKDVELAGGKILRPIAEKSDDVEYTALIQKNIRKQDSENTGGKERQS